MYLVKGNDQHQILEYGYRNEIFYITYFVMKNPGLKSGRTDSTYKTKTFICASKESAKRLCEWFKDKGRCVKWVTEEGIYNLMTKSDNNKLHLIKA